MRLVVPDARSKIVRRRVATQIAALDPTKEAEPMHGIEAVSVVCEPSPKPVRRQ
jgi:hypothetical protein